MSSDQGFDCYVIGGDTLLVECIDILRDAGHRVLGAITDAPRVVGAARERGIPVLDPAGYVETISLTPFDYFFSITHLGIVPEEVLALPARGAINFHDGPLPRYSGLNAPVWALLAGEPEYGVTWHMMTAQVDSGDIVAQTRFEVSPDETALSLNTKCMAAALESFPALVGQLAAGSAVGVPHERDEATHFRRNDRPPAACLIDWSSGARQLERFIRALTFGPYPNPIGVPKTASADGRGRPFIVTEARVAEARGSLGAAPVAGEVVEVDETGVTVGTGSGLLIITQVSELDGSPVAGPLGPALSLEVGARLLAPSDDAGRLLSQGADVLARSEPYWAARLADLDAPEIPQAHPGVEASEWASVSLDVRALVPADMVAALAVYLARTGRKERFHLGVELPVPEGLEDWCAAVGPLEVDLSAHDSFQDVSSAIERDLAQARDRGSFLLDLPGRTLAALESGAGLLPIGIDLTGAPGAARTGSVAILQLDPADGSANVQFDRARLDESAARAIAVGIGRIHETGMRR